MSLEETAAETLQALERMVERLSPEGRDQITTLRAAMDGYAVGLRQAGWNQGQIGAILLDTLLHQKGLEPRMAVALAIVVLK